MERRTYRCYIQDGQGTVTIVCDENADNAHAEALCERELSRNAPLGIGYRRFELLSRERL